MTADKARRLWEILLKIRDEEIGEHNEYEVVISEKRHDRPLRATCEKGNSSLAI